MRVLLDECVDRRLAQEIAGHGDLLALAQKSFDAFVTVDRNLSFQQRLSSFSIAVVVLRARTNRLVDLRPLMAKLLEVLPDAKRGEVTWVEL